MNKLALITGANRGIGFEVARQLGHLDVQVVLGVRDPRAGEAAAASLRAEGIDADALALDVASPASVAAAAVTAARYGHIDMLVNNAGIHPELKDGIFTPSALPEAMLRAVYETNVFGPLRVIQQFLGLIRKAEAGRIVNVSSTLGSLTEQSRSDSPYYAATTLGYNSSKAALNAVTIQFAKELAATPIKVNSACPGSVQTDMGGKAAARNRRRRCTHHRAPGDAPLRRPVRPILRRQRRGAVVMRAA